ncbi:hypothetical protein B0J12DRAFT_638086 [Macrophomina phaseolina]|uniref:inositol-phosphate phosphatase n=1 Tax=Macrophomina phaseolina TaxID=35725 RepID=A0ABQ8GU79_9PEZI|nr:hypothetical protein B0J12DRAFT_638086 [Macrophomina phaseolina]
MPSHTCLPAALSPPLSIVRLAQSGYLSTPSFPPAPLFARAHSLPPPRLELCPCPRHPLASINLPSHLPPVKPSPSQQTATLIPPHAWSASADQDRCYHTAPSRSSLPRLNTALPHRLSFSALFTHSANTSPYIRLHYPSQPLLCHSKRSAPFSTSRMSYSADHSDVSSLVDSPTSTYPQTVQETPLTSAENSVFDLADVDDLLLESLCGGHPLESVEQTLISIARRAGDMILAADPAVDDSDTKNNSSDRVTATDKAVEDMVFQTVCATYPKFDFLGEESFKDGTKLTDAPTIVADPIDGTLNFIHGFPNTAISLALTVSRKPVVGVVYNPFRGDLFTAIKGKGAFLTRHDGRRIRLPSKRTPSPLTSLNDCLVAVEWGNQRSGPNWDLRTSVHKKLLSSRADGGAMVHSVRSSGSAALDFCYVAAGWIDVFWEAGVWIWDICAGWIILQEAGGLVASTNPGDWDPELEGRCYLAVRAAPSVTDQKNVVEELWGLMDGKSFTYPVKK